MALPMKTRFAMWLFFVSLLVAPIARAQSPSDKKPGDDGWEAVNGQMVQPGEGFKANSLVAGAYGFIWLMVAGFVFSVWMRTESVERELERLKRQIETRR